MRKKSSDRLVFLLLAVFIVFMNFEGYFKLKFNYHPLAQGFKYIFAFVFFLIVLFKIGISKTKMNTPLLVFSAFVFIQFLNPLMWQGNGLMLSSIGMLYYIAFVPLFFIGYKLLDLNKLKKILLLILILTTISALFAHFQFISIQNDAQNFGFYTNTMGYPEESYSRIHNFALHGPLAFDVKPPRYWYSTGLMISLLFLFACKNKRIIYSILGINCLFALFMSGYRFAIVATAIALVIIFFFNFNTIKTRFKMRYLVFSGLMLLTLFIVLSPYLIKGFNVGRYQALANPVKEYFSQRGYTFISIFRSIVRFPMGIGLRGGGHVDDASFGVSAIRGIGGGDNYLLITASELGIASLIAIIWMFIAIKNCFTANNYRLKGFNSILNITLFALLVSFMFEVGFLPGEGPSYWMFWLFSGALFRLNNVKWNLDFNSFFVRIFNPDKFKHYTNKWIKGSSLPELHLGLIKHYKMWQKKAFFSSMKMIKTEPE